MIGSRRLVPVSLLLATTLAVVPMLLPGGLLGGGAPVASAVSARPVRTSPRVSLFVHLRRVTLPPAPARAARPVPPARPATATHTVVEGDTLWELASAARLSVAQLAAANGLSEDATLRLGQVLRVPAPGAAPVVARVPASAPAPSAPRQALAAPVQLRWPASGMITSRFGWRIQPIFRRPEFHTGLDIATRWGSPVLAARDGVVRFVGWQSGYGQMVIVEHGGGLETSYSHLSSAAVRPGEPVEAGQLLGRIGSTGWSTGPHLLFEVRWHGVPVDPTRYLN